MFQKLRNWNFGRKNNEKTPLVQEQLVEPTTVPAPVEPAPVEVPTQEPAPVEVPTQEPAPVEVPTTPAPPAKSNTNPLAYDELVYRDNNNLETSKPKKESTAAYTSGNYRDGYEPTKVVKKEYTYVNNYDQYGSQHGYWDRGGKKQRKSKKRTNKKRNSKKRRSNKKR
jgi:hypothetical protein